MRLRLTLLITLSNQVVRIDQLASMMSLPTNRARLPQLILCMPRVTTPLGLRKTLARDSAIFTAINSTLLAEIRIRAAEQALDQYSPTAISTFRILTIVIILPLKATLLRKVHFMELLRRLVEEVASADPRICTRKATDDLRETSVGDKYAAL